MLTLTLLALALAGFLIYVAMRPSDFRIERSLTLSASLEMVFARINDLRQFNSWNPFALADPAIQLTYSGSSSGQDAAYHWESKGRAGTGSMKITESTAPTRVVMDLKFIKPFAANNVATFALTPDGTGTKVTWSMTGCNRYTHKLMGTIFNMDKMVGGEFAKGLNNLKALVSLP